jgi:hypothetical protein
LIIERQAVRCPGLRARSRRAPHRARVLALARLAVNPNDRPRGTIVMSSITRRTVGLAALAGVALALAAPGAAVTQEADTFKDLGLIPVAINVSDAVHRL